MLTQQSDLSQGYYVEFYVHGDGTYAVGEPHPISEEKDEEGREQEQEPESIPDLTAALKTLLNVVKTNPIGASDQESFDAGYQAQEPKMSKERA